MKQKVIYTVSRQDFFVSNGCHYQVANNTPVVKVTDTLLEAMKFARESIYYISRLTDSPYIMDERETYKAEEMRYIVLSKETHLAKIAFTIQEHIL